MRQSLKLVLASLIWLLHFVWLPVDAQAAPAVTAGGPTVVMVSRSGGPAVPAGLKVTCTISPDSGSSSNTCPVLKFNGLTYWAYSYIDNRVSLAIVAYDSTGKVVKQWEKPGTRYIWQITVNTTNNTVAFTGQSSRSVTMSWSELTVNVATNGVWKLGKVTNNTDNHVMFSFHVPKNGSIGADALNQLTMIGILIDNNGILSIDPQGATSGCANPAWRTEIQFGSTIWEFYYNTGTTLDITLNPNQQFVFTPGPGGQIVPGGQPARCQ